MINKLKGTGDSSLYKTRLVQEMQQVFECSVVLFQDVYIKWDFSRNDMCYGNSILQTDRY